MKLLGIPIENISKEEVFEQIHHTKRSLFIVTLNPEMLVHAWRDKNYHDILNSADIRVADGIGIVFAARLLYGIKLERITGVDLAQNLIHYAAKRNKSVFLLGGTKDANKKALREIINQEVGIKAKGVGGKFIHEAVVQEFKGAKFDVVLVGLGAPKQELFIYDLLRNSKFYPPAGGPNSIFVGIGGTVDFWAYPYLRAPKFLQNIGLEWLWRLMLQPWRFLRITKAIILFPLLALKEKLGSTFVSPSNL